MDPRQKVLKKSLKRQGKLAKKTVDFMYDIDTEAELEAVADFFKVFSDNLRSMAQTRFEPQK